MTKYLNYGKLLVKLKYERRIGMKKIYEEPELDIEKFQFEPNMFGIGLSRDDPDKPEPDPFG